MLQTSGGPCLAEGHLSCHQPSRAGFRSGAGTRTPKSFQAQRRPLQAELLMQGRQCRPVRQAQLCCLDPPFPCGVVEGVFGGVLAFQGLQPPCPSVAFGPSGSCTVCKTLKLIQMLLADYSASRLQDNHASFMTMHFLNTMK